jgi:outer membrane protein TolC
MKRPLIQFRTSGDDTSQHGQRTHDKSRMKRILFACAAALLLLICPKIWGQPAVDTAAEKKLIEALLQNESLMDSLINRALMNSYWIKGFEAELAQQYENVTQEKNRWVSTFRMGINFFSVNTQVNANNESVTTAGILPQLGLTLSIDPERFISRKSYIREAQYNVTRAQQQVQHQRRQIRLELVQLFYQYLEMLGVLELRQTAQQTQQEQCILMEEKFKRGEEQMEAVLLNQNALLLTNESVIKAQLQTRKLKQQIEILTNATEGIPSTQP